MTLPEYVDFDLVIEAEGDDFVARVINAQDSCFLIPTPETPGASKWPLSGLRRHVSKER